MKLHYIATLFMTGAAAAAIAAAPAASAASSITSPGTESSTTTNQRPGNVEIQVVPPAVSDARSYGQFSSPAHILGD